MSQADGKWSVNYWMTHPELENDDCNTGSDYDTLDEAMKEYNNPEWKNGHYVEIDGPDIYEVKMQPGHDPKAYQRELELDRRQYEGEARRENAMQEGMGRGIQAYNEAMGCDVEPYEPRDHDSEPWEPDDSGPNQDDVY